MTEANVDFVKELLEQLPDWFNEPERMELAQMTGKNYPYTTLFSPIQATSPWPRKWGAPPIR
jgi:hypothetical protein